MSINAIYLLAIFMSPFIWLIRSVLMHVCACIIVMIVEEEKGENYMAIAGYYGEEDEDVSFPEGATVEVLEKSITGWWLVR